MRRLAGLVGLVVVGTGCSLTYAPPIRGLHAGMPGRLGAGQWEVGVTTGGMLVPTLGGAHVAYGLSETLIAEAGGNFNLVDLYLAQWATGWGGVRVSRGRSSGAVRLVGDLELGAGAGVGGRASSNDLGWTQLFTYGVYEGFGVGAQWRWLGLYVRGRLDAAAASGAPTTLWPTLMAGLEVRPGRRVSFGVGGGYGGHWNTADRLVNGWFYQAQVAILFGP